MKQLAMIVLVLTICLISVEIAEAGPCDTCTEKSCRIHNEACCASCAKTKVYFQCNFILYLE